MLRKQIIVKLLFVLLLIFIISAFTKEIVLKIGYPQTYKRYVEKYAKEYGIKKEIVFAIIKAESNFNKNAISTKQAYGLMQLLEGTATDVAKQLHIQISKEQLLDPEINIKLGAKYIATLIEKYNNIELALAAYNAGKGRVDKWIEEGIIKMDGTDIENIPYKETNNYVRKVVRNYRIYEKI